MQAKLVKFRRLQIADEVIKIRFAAAHESGCGMTLPKLVGPNMSALPRRWAVSEPIKRTKARFGCSRELLGVKREACAYHQGRCPMNRVLSSAGLARRSRGRRASGHPR